ncbi:MAG: hypothetical protein M3Q49_13195, partial [Actinomycetota bacterium]|nr:hypothetical protein [Actinomycetota bacterium]
LEEANRENRRIILALTSRLPLQLEAPIETRDASETARQAAGGVEDRGEHAEPQADAEERSTIIERPDKETARRSWWLRWFGG